MPLVEIVECSADTNDFEHFLVILEIGRVFTQHKNYNMVLHFMFKIMSSFFSDRGGYYEGYRNKEL